MLEQEIEYTEQEITILTDTQEVICSHDWFTRKGKYPPRSGSTVTPLVNGDQLFPKMAEAIKNAKKSIDIMMWDFDPLMGLELVEKVTESTSQDGAYTSKSINRFFINVKDLLEQAAQRGVICRILLWEKDTLTQRIYNFLTSANQLTPPQNPYTKGTREWQKMEEAIENWIQTERIKMDQRREWFEKAKTGKIANLQLVDQGFTSADKARVGKVIDQNLDSNWWIELVQKRSLSHHQKLMIVDYHQEALSQAKAFVMGSNMTPMYWDTKEHLMFNNYRQASSTAVQDISCLLQGSIVFDINENFVAAWDRVIGNNQLSTERQSITPDELLVAIENAESNTIQFCRTQPQEILASTQNYDMSIFDAYIKAINNTYDFIYIENQYFRYPTMARLIKQRAIDLYTKAEQEGKEKPLYLFVITNCPLADEQGTGGDTTYYTLKELGQQQLMTEAQRTAYHERGVLYYLNPLNWFNRKTSDSEMSDEDKERLETIKTQEDVEGLEQLDPESSENAPFKLESFKELKVVIATLTTTSTSKVLDQRTRQPAYQYGQILAHSKLMIVDDLWATIGSANINLRSMHSDSEANVLIPCANFSQQLRSELWNNHAGELITNNTLNNSGTYNHTDLEKYFNQWERLMNLNWAQKAKGEPLFYFLTRYWDTKTEFCYAID